MLPISIQTSGQIEAWVLKRYFKKTLEPQLIPYAEYWAKRLNIQSGYYIE